jgi:hypothetical protein
MSNLSSSTINPNAMKSTTILTFILSLCACNFLLAQRGPAAPEMDPKNFTVHNREVAYADGVAHLNANENDGVLWLKGFNFKNGTIELDIKGKNSPGQSFVGVAFHGKDDQTYDGVYFRPFNFKNPDRKSHAIQYISLPRYDWSALRNTFPGKYENEMNPVPDPDDWFSARIVVNYPQVKVYVDGSQQPVLEVEQLSDTKQGTVGLWVGNGSEGWFRNLKITSND